MNQQPEISIVIPAFNEAKRLGVFLDQLSAFYCSNKQGCQVIVVDDGSTDQTFAIAESYRNKFSDLSVIHLKRNRGKGYAVKTGLLSCQGQICAFLDADGSVGPEEIQKNIDFIIKDGYDIFIGSRAKIGKEQILRVKYYRKLIGLVFNFFIKAFLFKEIQDTQCGFKMFRKEVVKPLFSRMRINGFGFDVEMLYLAHKMGYKIKEGPVSWHHVEGCKVNLIVDSIKMFFNILQTRNWHDTPLVPLSDYMGPNEYEFMYRLENYHWWFLTRRKLVNQLLASFGIDHPFILDVGSGTGGNLLNLNKFGETVGIDISPKAIEYCHRRGLGNVSLCGAEKIQFPDRTFDIITCTDLLEHLADPALALQEIKRVLKDSGRIVITVPAFKVLWSQHDQALGHLRRYSKYLLTKQLQDAGFHPEKIGYFFFSSFFAVAPIRIIRNLLVSKKQCFSDTTTLPPKPLNELLKFIFSLELKAVSKINLPFGTTLYAVAVKK